MDLLPHDALPPFLLGTYGQQAYRLGRTQGRQQVALSADGETLWCTDGERLAGVSTQDGLPRGVLTPSRDRTYGLVVRTADDALLLLGHVDALWYDPRRAEALGACRFEKGGFWDVAASPTDPARAACVETLGAPRLCVFSREGRVVREVLLEARAGRPVTVAFTPDGGTVLVMCARAVLRFDARTGEARAPLYHLDTLRATGLPSVDSLEALAFADARTAVLVGGCEVLALDIETGALRARALLPGFGAVLARGPSAQRRLVIARIETLEVYALPALEHVATLEADALLAAAGDLLVDPVRPVAWLSDARGALHRVDLDAAVIQRVPAASTPTALAWTTEGALRVGRYDSPLETIGLADGTSRFLALPRNAHAYAFSDDGHAMLVHGQSVSRRMSLDDGGVEDLRSSPPFAMAPGRCWGVASGGLHDGARTLPLAKFKGLRVLVASPSGRRVLVVNAREAVLFDAEQGVELARYKLPGVAFARFVSDDEVVVCGAHGVRWIEALTGVVRAHAKCVGGARGAVSADGSVVAVLQGVDAATLVARDRPDAPVHFTAARRAECAAFSVDGRRLAVAGNEAVVRVFDVTAALATRPPPKEPKRAVKAARPSRG